MIVTDKLSTESFHAFIDEQLTDEQYVLVEAQLDEIPEKIEEIQQCHIINERLREVFDSIVEEPVPEDLYELALYGLDREYSEPEDNYNYEPGLYTELEEDIAAIDSLDIYPESEDENYLDDSEATDLEFLSQTEHLSDFDIDDLRSDSSNIIPDIFDDTDNDAMTDQGSGEDQPLTDPTDELLESIDTLSLELEKAHQNKIEKSNDIGVDGESFESEEILEPSEALLNELDNEDLELESLEDDAVVEERVEEIQESYQLEGLDQEEIQSSAKDHVLETLTPEEEMTLEPLGDDSNDAFIQESELSEEQENSQINTQTTKSKRPRNLRTNQAENETRTEAYSDESKTDSIADFATPPGEPEAVTATPSIEPEAVTATPPSEPEAVTSTPPSETEFVFQSDKGINTEDSLPEDLVAEFFAPNKGTDFEVNEVVKQFEEVSGNFAEAPDDHLFDDSPFANIKYKALDMLDNVNARINEFKVNINRKKQEIFGKFNGGQSITDFNKSPFEDFSSSRPVQSHVATDTLDLGAFEEVARESSSKSADFENDFYSDATTEQAHSDIFFSGPDNDESASSFNDGANNFSETSKQPAQTEIELPDFQNSFDKPRHEKPEFITTAAHTVKPAEVNFDMDFGLQGDEPVSSNLANKFGDRLKFYKQKIADMRANALERESLDVDKDLPAFEKFKNSVGTPFNSIQLDNNLKMGAVAVLAIGLVLGGILVAISDGSSQKINNDRVEALAIDSHLVNAQFNTKIVADADSAIIEKLQWFSARVGRQIRLADIKVEDFEFKKVSVMPTMASFAATNIFENKAGQRITLMAVPDIEGIIDAPISCRVPPEPEIDGLCVWVKDSVRYVAVASLSLSRVRSFSEQIIENL